MVTLTGLYLGFHGRQVEQMRQQRLPLPNGDPAEAFQHFLGVAGSFSRGKPGKWC